MDDLIHTRISKLQSALLTEKTPFCPEDQQIAEYFDGGLDEASRPALVRHLSECRFCQARVGILERLATGQGSRKAPGDALARAKQIPLGQSGRKLHFTPALAAAAVIVLALALVVGGQREPAKVPAATPHGTEQGPRELRTLRPGPSRLDVLFPAPGAEVHPGSLIRWAEVPGRLHYTIQVLSRTGDVLWTERLEENEWALRDTPPFEPGGDYWFRVEAMLADGRTLKSEHTAFRIPEPD